MGAARKGDAAKVKALVEQGVDVNAKTPQGTTALGLAADNGHLEVVQLLLRHKADVNGKDLLGFTPLGQALSKKHTAVAKALLEAGAEGAENALGRAAWTGQAELVQTILNKRKVKPEVISQALNWVQPQQGEVQKVLIKALLEAGGPAVENALLAAARTGKVDLVREVLARAKPKAEALTKALEATPAQHVEAQKLLLDAVLQAGGEAVHTALNERRRQGAGRGGPGRVSQGEAPAGRTQQGPGRQFRGPARGPETTARRRGSRNAPGGAARGCEDSAILCRHLRGRGRV